MGENKERSWKAEEQSAGMQLRELRVGSGALRCRVLLPMLAWVMLQETQTPEKAHDVQGIPSKRVVQKVGGRQTVNPSHPQELLPRTGLLWGHLFNHKDPYTEIGIETKREKRTKWTPETKPGPLRSWPCYFP